MIPFGPITKERAKDTGMALTVVALLVYVFTQSRTAVFAAIALLALDMIVPVVFTPLAYLWFGLAFVMGLVVSRLLFSITFFLLLTPVGIVRRLVGKDELRLRDWKAGAGSVFKNCEHRYDKNDLSQPY
ncbi:MAG: hypothetical protein GF418_10335 [Chitinivibrionales bacterium]|nr:hypothetical protein [Chitinivibrionales bacterium]MBD3396011.1 hypothetical protein [Chitinivibrionales bacterium]